ncbi:MULTISPECIES: YoaK family protein [Streptomyces]|uniref:YoaK family protein n=1 Tax=Streptomyces TaxID=1883 RepID=UPI0029BBD11C|nr:YoaK family protein [Streptomyces sp. WI03-4A]MDX2593805.1 YoaK family protein [Streptomyces sp. WI03-4A]
MATIHRRPDTPAVGALLAMVGGYLDAYTFVRHRVFANLQSGNVLLFCVEATARHWHRAVLLLIPVAAFGVGVLLVEILGLPRLLRLVRRPLRMVLTLQILLLAGVAAVPDDAPSQVTTVTVSFVAALQFSTFTSLRDAPYTTLAESGNLQKAIAAAHRWLSAREPADARRAGQYALVIAAFVVGAVLGAVITRLVGPPAVGVAAGLLAAVLALLIRETRRLQRLEAAGSAASPPSATP